MLKAKVLIIFTALLSILTGCDNLSYQPSLKANESNFIPPIGTVTYGFEENSPHFKLNQDSLKDGQLLYEKNCSACHGLDGFGRGITTTRGLTPPESFINDKIFKATPKVIYQTIMNGKDRMPSFVRRLTQEEAWKVSHFVKALQLSRKISWDSLDDKDKEKLNAP